MIRNYQDLTRYEMEQVDRANTIVLIPLGALEQHGSQAPLGTDDIIAGAMVKVANTQSIRVQVSARAGRPPFGSATSWLLCSSTLM